MEIICYGVIGDQYDGLDAATVTAAIRASTGPLSVRLNSPGGYVMEGLAIIAALRAYTDGPVTIYIDGLAASMASAIAMVGSEIVMAESALMMIHRPWDSSIGHADDLRRDAAKLDRVEAQLVSIYAGKTGLPEGEISAMLAAETWFTPEEALAAGFVTSIAAPLKIAAMADVSAFGFRHAPAKLTKETTMTDTATAVAEERSRISTIMALAEKHAIPSAMTRDLIDKNVPLSDARAQILDVLASRSDALNIGHRYGASGGGHVTLDDPATYAGAVTDALVAKISGKRAEGPAAEFKGMSVVDIARDFLNRRGARDVLRMGPERVMSIAMQASPGRLGAAFGGPLTTSDFPDLIGGASEKFLIERYKLQESKLISQQTMAEVVVTSTIAPGTQADINPFKDKLIPIADPNNWHSWGDAARTVISDVQRELMQMLSERNGGKGFFGSLLSSVFGGGGGGIFGGGNSLGDAGIAGLKAAGAFASGTEYSPAGMAWVGEQGPELVGLPGGSRVIPAPMSRSMMGAAAAPAPIHFHLRGAVVTDDLLRQMQEIANSTVKANAPSIMSGAVALTIDQNRRRQGRLLAQR